MSQPASRYDYQFDPDGHSTAARVCQLVGSGRRVLELGCAAGAMSVVLKHHYQCAVTGVEVDSVAAQAASAHCDHIVVASLEDPGWLQRLPPGQSYDAVLAADVLEHLHQPDECLRQLRALLPAHGRLVVSIPNIAHSGVLAALLSNDFQYADIGLLDRTHVHFFTSATLRQMLEHCGFSVTHEETVDAGSWHPEFQAYWEALPTELRDWLECNPAGQAYQVIMVAEPATPAPGDLPVADGAAIRPAALTDEQKRWLACWPGASKAPAALVEQDALQAQYDALQARLQALQAEHDALLTSRSWQLTAPLRALARRLRKP